MNSEVKICQNCKNDFTIEPDDFSFYEKMKVPAPTFCPECRYVRRLIDRNEYNLYKRKCDATGKTIITIYRPEATFPVYEQEYWKSDAWDAIDYGRNFNFTRSFFEQYEDLRKVVPHLAMLNSNSVNSEYTNQTCNNKDCYMLFTSGDNEKCMYGSWCQGGGYFLCDCYMAEKSQFCYESINITKCSRCAWVYDCADCIDIYFSRDCRGCTNCFGCVGLRNKQYYYFNENLGKDEYEKKINKSVWSRKFIKEMKEKSSKLFLIVPVKFYHGVQVQNSSGDYIENSQNMRYSFNCRDNKDTAYMQDVWKVEDCLDCTEIMVGQLCYETQGIEIPNRSMFIRSCFSTITDSCYCDMCFNVQDCFGCFGLRSKQYCILNKQYTKEEYFTLRENIIEHMRKNEEWGEYFPSSTSPFAYNESMAQDYFPITKEEALKAGYTWYDRPVRDYGVTLFTNDLPETLSETKETITDEIIQCSSQNSSVQIEKYNLCASAFKITPLELTFYKMLNLPIPDKCFPCRRQDRFKFRNPRKLWHRTCMCNKNGHFHAENKCEIEFNTAYSPDKSEIVYCEKCYQQEIY